MKQQYFCPACNRVVDKSEIIKGFEHEKDCFLVIEPEEIKRIEPETAHCIGNHRVRKTRGD